MVFIGNSTPKSEKEEQILAKEYVGEEDQGSEVVSDKQAPLFRIAESYRESEGSEDVQCSAAVSEGDHLKVTTAGADVLFPAVYVTDDELSTQLKVAYVRIV